ncbi:hypothetical protein PCE1_004544 [Barthelona sp. PCE]
MIAAVKESSEFIRANSEHVSINEEAVHKIASEIEFAYKNGDVSLGAWHDCPFHPQQSDNILDHVFVIDALNFCFWNEDITPYQVLYRGKVHHGYIAAVAALDRALCENIPITTPSFYADISVSLMRSVFRPFNRDGLPPKIPLLMDRVANLTQVGKVLVDVFGGSFENVVRAAGNSASTLVDLIYKHFECFRDECEYKGRKVFFLKRAQILAADVWGALQNSDIGEFHDINELTAFADYRIPQHLKSLGVLEYDEELTAKLESQQLIEPGDPMECEIRGCTIAAIEQIRNAISKDIQSEVNSVLIDFYLWDKAKLTAPESVNHITHRTQTMFY